MVDLDTFSGLDYEQRLDAAGGGAGYLVTGTSGTPIRLSASAYHLLQAARSGLGWDAVAEQVSRHRERDVSAAELEASYDRIVERLAEIDSRSVAEVLPPGFWLRWRLLSQPTVSRIAARLSALFALWPALTLLAAISLILGHALSRGLVLSFGGAAFWPAYALFTASLIAHELGHVSACRRYGARPNDIGFTVYWVFPAFYSDVTSAWQLERRHRVVVDLAGVFFQLAVGAGYWLGFLATGWRALEVAFLMIFYSCLFALNPIFKFDGYWVVADALGVTHLSRQPARIARHFADRLRGRPTAALPWPRWVTTVLAVYTPLSIAFWIYFVGRLAPVLWTRALTYPALLSQVTRDLLTPSGLDGSAVERLLISTFLLLVSGLMIRHLAGRLAGGLARLRTARS